MGPKRVVRRLAALCALGMLLYAAGPALSTERYMPGAVDFEQRLTGIERTGAAGVAKRAGDGPVSFRSTVIAAPKRFDLAGLAGETRPLEMRARERGGEWTRWTTADDGNPVYFGEADELQVRARGWRPRGTLHYVNVSGTTTASSSLLTGFRSAVNSAFVAAAAVVSPQADAAPRRPAMVTRAQWGAELTKGGCPAREPAEFGKVKAAVVHHTVTAQKYTAAESPGIVLGICRYHRNANGWNDIGYNALVDRFGTLYVGRAGGVRKAVIGAHSQGFNGTTTGIASIGTHTAIGVTPAELQSIASYLAWKLTAHALSAIGRASIVSAGGSLSRFPDGTRARLKRINGHRDVGLTECPGNALYAQLAQLRAMAQQIIDAGGGVPAPPPTTTPPVTPPVPVTPG